VLGKAVLILSLTGYQIIHGARSGIPKSSAKGEITKEEFDCVIADLFSFEPLVH
jgi:hypothetical protein